MKCNLCHKPCKENTEGNKRYCQGHPHAVWSDPEARRKDAALVAAANVGRHKCGVCDDMVCARHRRDHLESHNPNARGFSAAEVRNQFEEQ